MDLVEVSMKCTSYEFKLLFTFYQKSTWTLSINQHAIFVNQVFTAPDWNYHDIRHGSTNPTLSYHFNLQGIFSLFPGLYEFCV